LSGILHVGGGAEGWVRAGIEEGTCKLRLGFGTLALA